MPHKITTGFRALIDAAEREIETLPVEDAPAPPAVVVSFAVCTRTCGN